MRINLRITFGILLTIVAILMLLSGFGITQSPIMSRITFGLLTKPLLFKLHAAMAWPFVVLLIIHLFQHHRRRK